jgi:light-regulated signal transduction histidine kinase (bacteriophytochrome)
LRKISAFGQILTASLKNKLNEDEEENLSFMVDGANRMQQMIEALLTYSKVTTKSSNFESVDPNAVVEELKMLELAFRIEETGANVLTPEPLHPVMADPAQLRQLLQNLIANALKYQKEDAIPEVIISSRVVDNAKVRVEVQDNGIGIKEEHFNNIFTMFKRLHAKSEYEGTGIGLAVCKKIVERHGGTIGVSSTYGQGSTFWFTMPALETPATEAGITASLTA